MQIQSDGLSVQYSEVFLDKFPYPLIKEAFTQEVCVEGNSNGFGFLMVGIIISDNIGGKNTSKSTSILLIGNALPFLGQDLHQSVYGTLTKN